MKRKQKIWRWCQVASFLGLTPFLLSGYACSDFGRDHLCSAAYRGNLVEMWLLLSAGADPSRVGWEEHYTPLGETVLGGQKAAARLLIAFGADPNAPNDPGCGDTAATTGIWQPQKESLEVVALLKSVGGR